MIWYDMLWYDMIWYDMIWYDMIWYDMIWYDMIWYDMIWYDMIWYDMIYRGYYMAARRYEISLRVLKNISRVSAANEWNIFQHEKRNFVSPSDHVIFFLLYKILTMQQNMLCSLFQKLRFGIEFISLQSVVYLYQS